MAVGGGGAIAIGIDGQNWSSPSSGTINGLNGIVWSGSRFVAVGGAGTGVGTIVVTGSEDPSSWTLPTTTPSINRILRGIAWSGNRFVAVGDNGTILTSANGDNWDFAGVGTTTAALYSITWSGSRFVAVGTNMILTSADGITWSPVAITGDFRSIAWSGSQFVAVGVSGKIYTSSTGESWQSQTSGVTVTLRGITWSGNQFVAVGNNGTTLTSPDGVNWSSHTSITTLTLYGIAWSGNQFVGVGQGSPNNILTSDCPWGDNFTLADNRWTMIGLPAAPNNDTVDDLFGATLTGTYGDGAGWEVWQRLYSPVRYDLLDLTDPMALGTGYWIRSTPGATVSLSTASAPVLTHPTGCPSTVGCYAISLDTAQAGYKLVGFPLPYPIGWWDVRVVVNETSHTLDSAETSNFLASTYWAYNGTGTGGSGSYEVYDDLTPGMIGMPLPWQGWWVKVLASGVGQPITLLIPAIPKVSQAPAPKGGLERVLEMVLPAAQAAPPDFAPANGWREREDHRDRHGQALQEGREWYVRLIIEEPGLNMRDRNNVLGQLEDAAVGYDRHDLPELKPSYSPYLTIVFPHADWGIKAGDYASDFRPTHKGKPAANWRFEVRGDVARTVLLRWEGPAEILRNSVLLDEATGRRYAASDAVLLRDGLSVTMTGTVAAFSWRYSGKPNR